MSAEREERLGRLAEELEAAVAAGESLDAGQLGERYELPETEVVRCVAAVELLNASIEEDLVTRVGAQPPTLPEDYEVRDELGRGGMGIVYRVHQRSLDRDVALKVLRPGDLQFADAIERFEREARSLARLRHRNIVSVHEVGHTEGFLYFTMDLIEGRTLAELVADRKVTTAQAVRLLRQVCAAMAYAHSRGVVHRDLKPANILVDGDGDAFVVDFGLARDLGAVNANTLSGQLIGTPSYMSPEQALGDAERIGEVSDVYALGAVLYETLSGKAPFAGKPLAQLMYAVLEEEPPRLTKVNPQVPRDLAVICEKAMAKRPEHRYATVQAMADDLERFAGGLPIRARPPSTSYQVRRFAARHGAKIGIGSLATISLLAVLWWLVLPAVLTKYQLDLGDQLFAEGNENGAVHAYRSAFDQAGIVGVEADTRVRCRQLLVDHAARVYWEQGQGGWNAAQELLNEAARIRMPWSVGGSRELVAIENERLNVMLGRASMLDAALHFDREEFIERTLADLRVPARRPAALMQLVGSEFHAGLELDRDAKDGLIELIRRSDRMPDWLSARIRPESLRYDRGHTHVLGALRDPESVRKLQAIVVAAIDLGPRLLAARVLDKWGPFPLAVEERYATNSSPAARVGALGHFGFWLAKVQNAQSPKLAYQLRVEYAADAAFGKRAAKLGSDGSGAIRMWLHGMTGQQFQSVAEWQAWFRDHGKQDPRRWLCAALGWRHEPREITVDRVLAELRTKVRRNQQVQAIWLHNLLTLIARAGTLAPRLAGSGKLMVDWSRTLRRIPNRRLRVRLATFAQAAGRAELRQIWSKDVEIGFDQKVKWREHNETESVPDELVVSSGRMESEDRRLLHYGHVRAEWRPGGVLVHVNPFVHRRMRDGGFAHWSSQQTMGLGEVQFVQGTTQVGRKGHAQNNYLTFAVVEDAARPVAPRSWSDWRKGLLAGMSTGPNRREPLGRMVAASAIPLPEAKNDLLRPDDLHASHRPVLKRARLMAGDERALDDARSKDVPAATQNDPDFWCRLATSTRSERIRRHAFEQLQSSSLFACHLEALARDPGLVHQMPVDLAEQVDNRSSVTGAYLSRCIDALWRIGVIVVFLVCWLIHLLRSRGPDRPFAWFGVVMGPALVAKVEWAGVLWLPYWLGGAIGVAIAWWMVLRNGRRPASVWFALAWTAATFLAQPLSDLFMFCLLGVVMILELWRVLQTLRESAQNRDHSWRELRSSRRRRARRGGR